MPTTDHSEAAKKSIIFTNFYHLITFSGAWDGCFFVNKAVSINWWASLVPAAAVIPALVAYADFVDVKTLVVD